MWLNLDPEMRPSAKAADHEHSLHTPAPLLAQGAHCWQPEDSQRTCSFTVAQRRAISIRLSSSPTEVLSTDLGVGPDGFLALHAGVGAELLEALDAAVPPLLLHILLALQGVTAVVAVKALRHRAHGVAARPSCKSTVGEGTALRPWKLQGSSFLGLCRSVGGRWLRNEHVMVLSHSSRAPW